MFHDPRLTCDLVEGSTVTQQLASDVSAVVLSHDGYADLWPIFFELLFRFWPDLPYPLHLVSNHRTFSDSRVTPVRVGDDRSWSDTLARALGDIPSRYVLLLLEDYFLTGPVDTARIARLHAAMVKLGAVYLRLAPAQILTVRIPDFPTSVLSQRVRPIGLHCKSRFGSGQLCSDCCGKMKRRGTLSLTAHGAATRSPIHF